MTMRTAMLLLLALLFALAGDAGAGAKPAAGKPVVAKSAEKPRRLEDVRIEGDVPVPQVLFVTARDPRRFLEFQHGRYRKTSLQLSRESMSPARVVLVGNGPTVQHKESAP